MHITLLTLFPDMFPGTLGQSLAGKALERGLWSYEVLDIRDFATDKHHTVDDKSYGGGTGLVMKPDVVGAAIEHALESNPGARIIYPTPRGVPFSQQLAYDLASGGEKQTAQANLIILCGRYEGVDQRILDKYQPLEVSLGDYVLSGGEIAAQVILDACIRLIPGVISSVEALESESFSITKQQAARPPQPKGEPAGEQDISPRIGVPCESQQTFTGTPKVSTGLLEYPHYTSPPDWQGLTVPDVLLSGNHQAIAAWRQEQSIEITKARRPDIWTMHKE